MEIRKSTLLIATLAIFNMPLIANAALKTYNYTNEDSSVKVTSGSIYPCSFDKGVYTPKMNANGEPGYSEVNDTEINGLCITSKNKTCTADIYNTNNCTGNKIGEASLDLKTKRVTAIASKDTRYRFEIEDNGTKLRVKYTN